MTAEDLLRLARFASLAPSSHNTQPWRFHLGDRRIDVLADRTRALPENDPVGRELTISCGCALMNLRVAALHFGFYPDVQLLPEPDNPDTLARVRLSDETNGADDSDLLFEAIERRSTYRKHYEARAVSEVFVRGMIETAAEEGAELTVISDRFAREKTARLVAEGDSVQWSNGGWRKELAHWMRPPRRGDGLAASGLAGVATRIVIRKFNMGRGLGARDRQLAMDSPILALLGTRRDDARDWLAAGQALERTLLWAAGYGLQASFLNQPIQVAPLRDKLRDLFAAHGFPQILFRIGYPSEAMAVTPRRELSLLVSGSVGGAPSLQLT